MTTARQFSIELALARLAVGMCGRHKDDLGCAGLVWQVQRLADEYSRYGETDKADKLNRIIAWWDAGAVPSDEKVVLSDIPPFAALQAGKQL